MAWFGKRDAEAGMHADPELESEAEGGATAMESVGSEPEAFEPEAFEPEAFEPEVPARADPTPAHPNAVACRSVVFQPDPLGDDDGSEAEGAVAFVPGTAPALANAPEMTWSVGAQPVRSAPGPRTPPQEKMAEIAEGLRQHGPMPLNFGGPGPVPRDAGGVLGWVVPSPDSLDDAMG